MIYFAAVPDAMSLPPLPAGMNMVRSYPHVDQICIWRGELTWLLGPRLHPTLCLIILIQITLSKYEYASNLPAILFAEKPPAGPPSSSDDASAPPPPPSAPSRSDSDLAKELQEKLNTGL